MGKYRIEIIRDGDKDSVNIEGCRRVEKYSPEEIILSLKGRNVTLWGRDLNMPVLVDGNLCVKGYIKTLSFQQKEGCK